VRFLTSLVLACLLGSSATAEQLSLPGHFIKPSDVKIPAGTEWGQIKRTIQPFENWTLICDENLKLKQRTCNASQIIVDQSGNQIFSWSLAATQDGKPFMLLRVKPSINRKIPISVWFPDRQAPIQVSYTGCDNVVCLGVMPVGPVTRANINKGSDLKFTFQNEANTKVEIIAPLKGLKDAINAI